MRRVRSTRRGVRASPASATGAIRWATCPSTSASPQWTSTRPPGLVAMKATPTTRSPTSRACSAASAICVIPPRECPISTTGPVGATAWSTEYRSRPHWSTVHEPRGPASDLPWPRWSHSTRR